MTLFFKYRVLWQFHQIIPSKAQCMELLLLFLVSPLDLSKLR